MPLQSTDASLIQLQVVSEADSLTKGSKETEIISIFEYNRAYPAYLITYQVKDPTLGASALGREKTHSMKENKKEKRKFTGKCHKTNPFSKSHVFYLYTNLLFSFRKCHN